MRFTKWFADLWRHPAVLLVLVALALAWPVLRPGYALFWGTPYFQFIPWRWLAWQQLAQGSFPWWNPYNGLGTPLFANYQSAVLYPPTWLTFMAAWLDGLGGLAYAHGWVMVLHWLWAAWGMACFTRRQGFPREAAWFSGLVYAFSGYSVARAGIFPSMNAAMSWTPWVLWAVDGLRRQPGSRWIRRLAVVLALQLLSGHAQTTWYTGLLALARFLWGPLPPGEGQPTRGRAVLAGVLALFLALMLSLGQLAATAQYTRLSQRAAGLPEDFALQYSFWPWHYLNLLNPRMFGHPAQGNVWGYGAAWEDAVYIGVLPLLLAGYALITRGRANRFWALTLLVTQVFALGWFTPVYPWLFRHVPTFATFQAPTRWHLVTMVALAYLAGDGLRRWRRPQGRGLYWARLATAAAAGTALTAAALTLVEGSRQWTTLTRGWAAFGFWAMGSGLVWLYTASREQPMPQTRRLLPLLWVALDLAFNQQGWLPATPVEAYTQPPSRFMARIREWVQPGFAWIPAQDAYELLYEDFLTFTSFKPRKPLPQARQALLPNVNVLDRIPVVNAFDPLLPGRYVQLMEALEQLPEPARARLLERLAVNVIVRRTDTGRLRITVYERNTPGIITVQRGEIQDVEIWRYRFPPRAAVQWFPQAEWVAPGQGLETLLRAARQGGSAWEQRVRVEAPEDAPRPQAATAPVVGQVTWKWRQDIDGSWWLEGETPAPGFLLIVQNAYPGWQAWRNGEPLPIYVGEHALTVLYLPAGQHQIRLVYRPTGLILALLVQLAAWGGLVVWSRWPRDRA